MTKTCPIIFGTSGWRGIIARDFTFDNVRIASLAIVRYLQEQGLKDKGVIVGYDTRFLSEAFAKEVAGVLAIEGIPSFFCDKPTPTPVIAHEILRRGVAGGINITASHNPPSYNGLKFSPEWGGPALPETTERLEAIAGEIYAKAQGVALLPFDEALKKGWITLIDPSQDYFNKLDSFLDIGEIQRARPKVLVDVLNGTGAGYLDRYLLMRGIDTQVRRSHPDPTFGGMAPDPAPQELTDTIRIVKEEGFDIALATDGDADRYGIVDRGGTFVVPNTFLGLLFHALASFKGLKGDAARSVATSHFMDAVAQLHGRKVTETKVGFKYLGQVMKEDGVLLVGEESAGLSLKGHVPEKDGILACLLALETVCRAKSSLESLKDQVWQKTGPFFTNRINIPFNPKMGEVFKKLLQDVPDEISGVRVVSVNRLDGTKWMLEDGSWILLRPSGTEPIIRVYLESRSEARLLTLESSCRKIMEDLWKPRP
jgi:alpha-D-glucose phosphate-specific phosphoglucomutase